MAVNGHTGEHFPLAPLISDEDLRQFRRTTTLRQIEIVCVVWRVGSITEAAKILGISAAGVSRMCQRFENHFNFAIFEKRRHGIRLTPEGARLLEGLSKLEQCIDETSQWLAKLD